MAGAADPPFSQRDLIYAVARKLGTLTKEGKVRPQVTARELGLGPNGTQRIRRLLDGPGVLHWDEAYRLYQALGWINQRAVQQELNQARLHAEAAAAAGKRARDAAEQRRQDD